MSLPLHQGGEGSLSESVQFPPSNGFGDHQGNVERRLPMVPPLSSASRAPSRPPFHHHDDERVGSHCLHGGGFDRSEYDCPMRSRHNSYVGEHVGLHSGALIEQLLLQENEKALRIASLVQSQQASGCLSGCFSCGLAEKRLRFKDHENHRLLEEQRWCSRSSVGEGPSKSMNVGMMDPEDVDSPDRWFRQLRHRQPFGGADEGVQGRFSFSGEELGHSTCQGRRSSCPGAHPGGSVSQVSHHMQDGQLRSVVSAENIAPVHGYSDGDGRFRQRWPNQRPIHSGINTEEGWQSSSRSGARVAPPNARDENHPTSISFPGLAAGTLSKNSGKSSHGVAATSVTLLQSQAFSEGRLGSHDSHPGATHQQTAFQQPGAQLLVTQGPVTLTSWYLIKIQDVAVGRVLETRVAVGGLLFDSREQVKTAPIVNRLDFRKVITEDGIEVSLEGSINQEMSIANGFSAGIVQCLSTGFPYLWKQYMRVRPAGQSSSMAVSGSLGGCDAKASKAISEDVPNPATDCEAHSAADNAGAVTEEPSKSENPAKDIPSTTSSEAVQMVRVKAVESLETLDKAAVADHEVVMEKQSVNDIMDSLNPCHTPTEIMKARVEVVESVQTLDTAAVCDSEVALEEQPVDDIIDSLDPGSRPSVGIEGVEAVQSLQTLARATVADPDIALDKLVDDIIDSLDPGPIPQPPVGIETMRMGAMESVEALDKAAVADPEIAIEKQAVGNGIVDKRDSGPMSGANVEIMDTEASPKVGRDGCASSEPVKRSHSHTRNKTKKGSLQPVRCSKRRQQQLGLLDSDKGDVSTIVSVGSTPKTMVGTLTSKGVVDVGSTHVERVTRFSEEVTRADDTSMGSPPVKMPDSGDVEHVNQVNAGAGAQGMQVEEVQQASRNAGRDQDQSKIHNSHESEAGFRVIFRSSVSVDPAPIKTPEVTNKRTRGKRKCLDMPLSASEVTKKRIRGKRKCLDMPLSTSEVINKRTRGKRDCLDKPLSTSEVINKRTRGKSECLDMPLSASEVINKRTRGKSECLDMPLSAPEVINKRTRGKSECLDMPLSAPEVINKRTRGKSECLDMPLSTSEVNHQTPCLKRVSAEFSVPVIQSWEHPRRASDAVDTTNAGPITSNSVPVIQSSRCLHRRASDAVDITRTGPITSSSVPVTRSSRHLHRRASDAVETTSTRPITSSSVPVTRSSRRLHRLSDACDPGTEPASRSPTPQQMVEMDAVTPTPHARKSGGMKVITCSRCEVPIIPQNVEYSIGQTFQQVGHTVPKIEPEEYTPVISNGSGASLATHAERDEGEFRTPDVKEKSSITQVKNKESASQSRRKSKFLKVDDNEGMKLASSVGRSGGGRRSIIPPPLPPPRVQDKSKVSEAFGLKTSRSGRLLVPPLAYWRSQSIGYDMDGGIIAIFDGFEAKPADTGCFTFTPPQEEEAKKIQKKLCEAAITVPKRKM